MIKKIAVLVLTMISFNLYAEDISFTDKNGQKIECHVDKSGQSNCLNSNKEVVICGNNENGDYVCSSH